MSRIGSVIVLGIGFGLIGIGGYAILSSGVPQAAVVSFMRHLARQDGHRIEGERLRAIYEAEAAPTVCPEYLKAGFIDRHWSMRKLKWCEAHRDRLENDHV